MLKQWSLVLLVVGGLLDSCTKPKPPLEAVVSTFWTLSVVDDYTVRGECTEMTFWYRGKPSEDIAVAKQQIDNIEEKRVAPERCQDEPFPPAPRFKILKDPQFNCQRRDALTFVCKKPLGRTLREEMQREDQK